MAAPIELTEARATVASMDATPAIRFALTEKRTNLWMDDEHTSC